MVLSRSKSVCFSFFLCCMHCHLSCQKVTAVGRLALNSSNLLWPGHAEDLSFNATTKKNKKQNKIKKLHTQGPDTPIKLG